MKILVIGSGGREHALAWKLRRGASAPEVIVAPGNPGMKRDARLADLPLQPPFAEVIRFCAEERIDFVVPGPEAPLVAGLADALARERIPCFGPVAAAARLEGSKAFTRELLAEAGVPSYEFAIFDDAQKAQSFYRSKPRPWWIKADGLAAGKGAVLPPSAEAGCALLRDWLAGGAMGEAGRRVVIEEPMTGPEVSIIALVAGGVARLLAPSQDHKRLHDRDEGPNTGGMGAFAPTPTLSAAQLAAVEREILQPTIAALARRGVEFTGVLYAGLILTPQGPRLLEYNVRFGDPETQVILPLLENDLASVFEAALAGRLDSVALRNRPGAAVVVVGAAQGYPEAPRKGDPIRGLDAAEARLGGEGAIFYAGVREGAAGEPLTSGGRVLGVMAMGAGLGEARDRAYAAMERISWPGLHYRRDIAAGR